MNKKIIFGLSILMLLIFAPTISAHLDDGLVSWYYFSTGADVSDHSTMGWDLTNNGTSTVVGPLGTIARVFDGTNDMYHTNFNDVCYENCTLCYWMKPSTVASTDVAVWWGEGFGVANGLGYEQEAHFGTNNAGPNALGMNIEYHSSPFSVRFDSGMTPVADVVYHVCYAYRDLHINGSVDGFFWINGTLNSSTAGSLNALTNNWNGAFKLGRTWLDDVNRDFDGVLDDIAIWNRTLNQDEIEDVFAHPEEWYGLDAPNATYGYYEYTDNPYYSFKISNQTGQIENITVSGRSVPVVEQLDFLDNNITGSGYDTHDVTVNIMKNGSLYDIIKVSYYYELSEIYYGVCNDTYNLFADSPMIYGEHQCEQYINPLYIFEMETKLTLNNANSSHVLINTSFWEDFVFDGSGDQESNSTVMSGSGTANNNPTNISYMIATNGTSGYTIFGTLRYGSNLQDGMNKQHNPTYFIADDRNSSEYMNAEYGDYKLSNPNISLIIEDDITTSKIIKTHKMWDGLDGFAPHSEGSYKLEAPFVSPDRLKVAKDFVRSSFFLRVGNETEDFKAEAEELNDNIFYDLKGRSIVVNAKNIQWKGQGADMSSSWSGTLQYTFGWHTTSFARWAVKEDSNDSIIYNEITRHYLLFHCYDRLYIKERDGGWWQYDNIDYSSLYKGNTYLGNAIESIDSCNAIQYNSYLDDYPEERVELRETRLNASYSLKLNPNTDLINRKLTIDGRIDDDVCEWNMSTMPKPTYNMTTKPFPSGGFKIYNSDAGTSPKTLVSRISCNKSNGTYLWEDTFITDNSSSYNLTNFAYDANLKGLYVSGTGLIAPDYTVVDQSEWVNYTCSFDLHVMENTTTSLAEYMTVALRYNSSDDPSGAKHGIRPRTFGLDTTQLLGATGSKYAWWVLRDELEGIFDNRWTSPNTTAHIAIYAPQQPTYRADISQIMNQGMYYNIDVAEMCREAVLGGHSGIATYRCEQVQRLMDGLNWLNTANPVYMQPDGFWSYSLDLPRKDGKGYFTNSVLEISKIQRGANGSRWLDLPALAYYIRHARHNTSQGVNTTDWRNVNALYVGIDTRVTQFSGNEDSTGNLFTTDNNLLLLYPDDLNKTIGYKRSNCSDLFAGKIGIYYPDSHWKLNYTDGMAYLTETCSNIRIGTVNDAMVQDAYQLEDTTNITVVLSPIPYPQHDWCAYDWQCGRADNESLPLGSHVSSSSTFWNNSAHIWTNNETKYTNMSFIVLNTSNVSLIVVKGNVSANYSIKLDGVEVATLYTDKDGNSNESEGFIGLGNAIVTVELGEAAAAAIPPNFQTVYTNVTNGSSVNWSVMNNWIAGWYYSGNVTPQDLRLYLNDSLVSTMTAVNWTIYTFHLANVTSPGHYHAVLNNTYNTTHFAFTITNTTTAPAPNTSTNTTNTTCTSCPTDHFTGIGLYLIINIGLFLIIFWMIERVRVDATKFIERFKNNPDKKAATRGLKIEIIMKLVGLMILTLFNLIVSGYTYYVSNLVNSNLGRLAFIMIIFNIVMIIYMSVFIIMKLFYFPFEAVNEILMENQKR